MSCITFYAGAYHFLSNFSAFEVELKGGAWKTAEHAYQAQKCIAHPSLMQTIQHAPSAYDSKKLAAAYGALQREDRDLVKRALMEKVVRAQHQQYLWIQKKLLGTYGSESIEASLEDAYWGR
ncbi:MAG: NADAR family protein [bacterium]|nr:NADAR family protein [bacterium]